MQATRFSILHILLSFVLVVSLMPTLNTTSAFAAEDTSQSGNDAETSVQDLAVAPGWEQCGECEWQIAEKKLTVRPISGGSGLLDKWDRVPPWEFKADIVSAIFEPGVKAQTCMNMFIGCSSLTSLDLSGLDTSHVTDMSNMFDNCHDLASLDLSDLDTSRVTNMSSMFTFCPSLISLNLSGFNTSNVTDMSNMFDDCSSLTSLNLSSFETSNVTNMNGMFALCSSLTSIDLSSFETSNVTKMEALFSQCSSLPSINLSGLDTSNASVGGMFCGCSSLTTLDLSDLDTSSTTDMMHMFNGCSSLTSLDLSSLDTSNVTDMRYMFENCTSLVSLNMSGIDTSNVTNMRYMFENCTSLVSLDLSGIDTSNVTDMGLMFGNCTSLVSLDLSSFDTSKVKYMLEMFEGCVSLAEFKVGNSYKACEINGIPEGKTEGQWWSTELDSEVTRQGIFNRSNTADTYLALTGFDDVDNEIMSKRGAENVWYVNDGWLSYVIDNGLMSGYASNRNFGPYDNITRGQVAVILYRYADGTSYGSTTDSSGYPSETVFKDEKAGVYYTAAINWAKDAGIMTGDAATGFTTVRPDAPVTREELCLMLYRFANARGAGDNGSIISSGILGMDSVSSWAREGVVWAVSNGVIGGVNNGNGTFSMKPQDTTWRASMAKMITVTSRDVLKS